MKQVIWCGGLLLGMTLVAVGGLVLEFDGKRWSLEPSHEVFDEAGHTSALVMAPSGTRMAEFEKLFGVMHRSPIKTVKFQLADQLGSVTMARSPMLVNQKEEVADDEIRDGDFVVVTTGPRGTFLLARHDVFEIEDAKLGLNLEGVQEFLNVAGTIAKDMKGEGGKRHPLLLVAARSDCSFGQFVTALQLLKQSGFPSFVVTVNDELPDSDVEVKKHKERDLQMTLPSSEPVDGGQQKAPLLVTVDAKGVVFVGRGRAREKLDSDPDQRELPALLQRLGNYAAVMRKQGREPLVHLEVHDGTSQQRIVDVLNALAKEQISKVTMGAPVQEEE